jgi:hypothetical protein
MNLLPIWWRLDSIAELAPYPREQRRRLWQLALRSRNKNALGESIVLGGLIAIYSMSIQRSYERWFGTSQFLQSWANLVKTATGGLLQLSPVALGGLLFSVVTFSIFYYVYSKLIFERDMIRRLRQLISAQNAGQAL